MFLPFHPELCLLSASICSAGIIQTSKNEETHPLRHERALPILASVSQDLLNTSSINALAVFNTSSIDEPAASNISSDGLILVETSPGNIIGVTCDARKYGGGLAASSCFNALRYCPTGDTQESWGYHGYGSVDVEFPIKIFSGK